MLLRAVVLWLMVRRRMLYELREVGLSLVIELYLRLGLCFPLFLFFLRSFLVWSPYNSPLSAHFLVLNFFHCSYLNFTSKCSLIRALYSWRAPYFYNLFLVFSQRGLEGCIYSFSFGLFFSCFFFTSVLYFHLKVYCSHCNL